MNGVGDSIGCLFKPIQTDDLAQMLGGHFSDEDDRDIWLMDEDNEPVGIVYLCPRTDDFEYVHQFYYQNSDEEESRIWEFNRTGVDRIVFRNPLK